MTISYCFTMCRVTSSLSQHVLKMSAFSTNACHSPYLLVPRPMFVITTSTYTVIARSRCCYLQ